MVGYSDVGPGKDLASKAVIVLGDPYLDIDLSVRHRAAQIEFCFIFADTSCHNSLERVRKRLPIRSVCHKPPPPPPSKEVGAEQHLGGGGEVQRAADPAPRLRINYHRTDGVGARRGLRHGRSTKTTSASAPVKGKYHRERLGRSAGSAIRGPMLF
jgi:hypothetical protein